MATAVILDRGFVPPTTGEGLLALPENVHGEICRGVFVPMVAPGGPHGSVAARVLAALAAVVYARGLGEVFAAETAFRLERAPDTVRCPDAAFVGAPRLPHGVPGGVFEGAPDLAVEVLSPSNTPSEMQRKLAEYLRHGSREVWVVDPDARSVTAYAAGGLPRFFEGDDVLDGGDLLPGFSTPVTAFFAGLPPLSTPGQADPPVEPPAD